MITISSSAARIAKLKSNSEAISILGNSNIEAIDYWLYLFSWTKQDPFHQDNWKEFLKAIREEIRATGLPVTQCHALYHIFVPSNLHYEPPQEIIYRNLEACAMLDCHRLIFHPVSMVERVTDSQKRQAILDYNIRWFGDLLPKAEDLDLELHIENVFDWGEYQKEEDPPFVCSNAEDICYVLDQLKHPRMKSCLDTGHANIMSQDVPAFIRTLGSRLGSLHLNDNYGYQKDVYDPHLLPGKGNLDWDAIVKALKEVGYSGTLNMEPVDTLPKETAGVVSQRLSNSAEFLRKLGEKYNL